VPGDGVLAAGTSGVPPAGVHEGGESGDGVVGVSPGWHSCGVLGVHDGGESGDGVVGVSPVWHGLGLSASPLGLSGEGWLGVSALERSASG
jgi:hypothetical protein